MKFIQWALYDTPRSLSVAKNFYSELATQGNSHAQYMLGFMYSTGIGVPQRDLAKGLLYYTFAALGGDIASDMTLGYWYHQGIGVSKSCDDGVEWYRRAAKQGNYYFNYYFSFFFISFFVKSLI